MHKKGAPSQLLVKSKVKLENKLIIYVLKKKKKIVGNNGVLGCSSIHLVNNMKPPFS
jgi:hypothetical protein